MKKRLTFISFLLAIILCTTPVSAYAATPSSPAIPSSECAQVPEGFAEVCDLVFSGKGEVFNSEGDEITQVFIDMHLNEYNTQNYTSILEACYNNGISSIRVHREHVIQSSTRANLILSYEEEAIHFIKQVGGLYDGKTWYLDVIATGTYVYHDATSAIQSVHTPTISVYYSELGALFSGSLNSITTTTPVISNDKSHATFNVTTVHTVSCPIPGLNYITGTLGPFTNVSYFTISPF